MKTARRHPIDRLLRQWHKRAAIAIGLYFVTGFIANLVGPDAVYSLVMSFAMQAVHIVFYFGIFFWYLGGRIRQKLVLPGDFQFSWDDYVGNDAIKERAKLITELLVHKEWARKLGGIRPQHMLFHGPTGTGKSYLAKIIAAEANVPVLVIECSSLLGTFVGIGALKAWNLFKKLFGWEFVWGGAIMVLDEIDTVARPRSGTGGAWGMFGGNISGQVLNVILTCISGINEPTGWAYRFRMFLRNNLGVPYHWASPNVIVIGVTNVELDQLDSALLRPGRLEGHIYIGPPDRKALGELIKYYFFDREYEYGVVGVPHDESCDTEAMAQVATGTTQAGIEAAANDVKRLAIRDKVDQVGFSHWLEAVTEARMGPKQPRALSGRDVEILSYHEGGHTLAAYLWGRGKTVVPVATIECYGGALGHIQPMELVEHILKTGEDIETTFMIYLGSLVAEELFGQRTQGTSRDLDACRAIVNLLISQGIVGHPFMVLPVRETGGRTTQAGFLVANLTEDGYKCAVQYYKQRKEEVACGFRENWGAMQALAGSLQEKRTLYRAQIEEAIDGLWEPLTLKPFKFEGSPERGAIIETGGNE